MEDKVVYVKVGLPNTLVADMTLAVHRMNCDEDPDITNLSEFVAVACMEKLDKIQSSKRAAPVAKVVKTKPGTAIVGAWTAEDKSSSDLR